MNHVVAPTFAIKIVIGINIKKAGIFIKPILKGIFVLIIFLKLKT